MPKWYDVLFLPQRKLNIMHIAESYDVHRVFDRRSEIESVTYYAGGADCMIKVRQTFACKKPEDLILWSVYKNTLTGATVVNSEANTLFAKRILNIMHNKYTTQHTK